VAMGRLWIVPSGVTVESIAMRMSLMISAILLMAWGRLGASVIYFFLQMGWMPGGCAERLEAREDLCVQ
jgi:hypothetical protein